MPPYCLRGFARTIFLLLAALIVSPGAIGVWAQDAEAKRKPKADAQAVERVGEDIRYLASDELEGRGPNTKGLELAAKHLEDRFRELGLAGGGLEGSYRRPFDIPIDNKVLPGETKLVLAGPDGKTLELALDKDFQPLAAGGEGAVEADVVFVGYGISAPKLKYDEYEGVDVAGKVVVLIRREPQQEDEKSPFDGKRTSSHAFIQNKIAAAKKAKAAAIVMVNDPHSTRRDKRDELTAPNGFGSRGGGIPFAHITQARLNELLVVSPLQSGDQKLSTIEEIADHIDATLQPVTTVLPWKATLACKFETVRSEVTNVVGVLEGEGPLADETIVVGAHYDHLGYGPFGSRRPGERAIHNGADDNATGTAAVLELARRFARADRKPARRMVFVGFTAEERGVLGSNHYVANPAVPLDKTVAMINFDMIGRYGEQGVSLGGVTSGREFGDLLDRATREQDWNVKRAGSLGGSDHMGFYAKNIPVMFFHTGLTDLYHTPEDDFETIDVEGAVITIDLAEAVLKEIVELPKAPEFVKAQPRRRAVVYLGIVPSFQAGEEGVRVQQVADGSPAAKGGMQADDVIIKLGDREIKSFQQLPRVLGQHKAGDTVTVVVRRGDKELSLEVKLAGPPQ
ncbi:MAG: M20/M25/M40 family metallo-hydrolase [Planctomycetales bacterium]|nr:M20/M25/M40 family metallo-hydrolase [Planctomycetales bacterium]